MYTPTVVSGSRIPDFLNLALAQNSKAPYNLTGELTGECLDSLTFNVNMSSCNTSIESNEFLIDFISTPWSPPGCNWSYPLVNLNFDSRTANITVHGYFSESSHMLRNATDDPTIPGTWPAIVYSKKRLSFIGAIDISHSDILVNNSARPQWIRTVGFRGNSLNIGQEARPQQCSFTVLPADRLSL